MIRRESVIRASWLRRGANLWQWAVVSASLSLLAGSLAAFDAPATSGSEVVVYAAQDQEYAEPILRQFEKETGIRARAVFDSEAVKTVGLANRLLSEQGHPQCDVFWSNEELRTRQLSSRGAFRSTNGWLAIGYRSRRIALNTNQVKLADAPRSLIDLTNRVWKGKIALAYPLFGTTAAHFMALRQTFGATVWHQWCLALRENKPMLVDGNSVVAQMVGRGEVWIGLTDSDDIAAEQREGAPIVALPLTRESLLIPNTVAVVKNAPHAEPAQRLVEYLQRKEILQQLIKAHALEGGQDHELARTTLKPDWDVVLADLSAATAELEQVFIRP